MAGSPHPFNMIWIAEQRHAEFQTEAARDRLGRLGQPSLERGRQWPALATARAIGLVLTSLFTAWQRV
jgi:hypothetical protein